MSLLKLSSTLTSDSFPVPRGSVRKKRDLTRPHKEHISPQPFADQMVWASHPFHEPQNPEVKCGCYERTDPEELPPSTSILHTLTQILNGASLVPTVRANPVTVHFLSTLALLSFLQDSVDQVSICPQLEAESQDHIFPAPQDVNARQGCSSRTELAPEIREFMLLHHHRLSDQKAWESYCDRENRLALGVRLLQADHSPVRDHTSENMWVAQIGLGN